MQHYTGLMFCDLLMLLKPYKITLKWNQSHFKCRKTNLKVAEIEVLHKNGGNTRKYAEIILKATFQNKEILLNIPFQNKENTF